MGECTQSISWKGVRTKGMGRGRRWRAMKLPWGLRWFHSELRSWDGPSQKSQTEARGYKIQGLYLYIRPVLTWRLLPEYGNNHGQGCFLSPELFLERNLAASHIRQHSSSWRNACLSLEGAVCLGSAPALLNHHSATGWTSFMQCIYPNLVELLQHPRTLLFQGKLTRKLVE